MTRQLIELIERVKNWPVERRQDVARMIEAMKESGSEVYRLSDEERHLIDEGIASPVVSDGGMEKFWNRHRI